MKKKNLINYIYEDDDIVVLSKPAGILTLPDRYKQSIVNLKKLLEQKYGEIYIVHRLDKDTSGVMIFAKNAEAHKHLNMQFDNQKVKKIYHAVISGIFDKDDMEIDIPLMPHPSGNGTWIPSARGKESLTIVRVLEKFRNATLIECNLVTGRHHQIRVHCSAIGYPLFVDELYGRTSAFYLSSIKPKYNLKKNGTELPIISRLTLHSYSISFVHPKTEEDVTFFSEYPKDFEALLKVLRKYNATYKFNYTDFYIQQGIEVQ